MTFFLTEGLFPPELSWRLCFQSTQLQLTEQREEGVRGLLLPAAHTSNEAWSSAASFCRWRLGCLLSVSGLMARARATSVHILCLDQGPEHLEAKLLSAHYFWLVLRSAAGTALSSRSRTQGQGDRHPASVTSLPISSFRSSSFSKRVAPARKVLSHHDICWPLFSVITSYPDTRFNTTNRLLPCFLLCRFPNFAKH